MENSYYISKRVVRANPSKVHLTLIRVSKHEVHITSEVCKSKLIKLNKEIQPILIVIKCNEIILSKVKVVKFIAWAKISKDITKLNIFKFFKKYIYIIFKNQW